MAGECVPPTVEPLARPKYDYDDVNEGLNKYYWKPWREYLKKKVA
jgi:hypothetical protein